MNRKKKNIYLAILLMALSHWCFSTARTWTGATSTAWNVSTNWSPNGIPGSTDVLTFDASSSVACSTSTTISVAGIIISGYTGTITQGSIITVGSSGFSISSGTFTGGTQLMTVNGPFSISGGTFTSTTNALTLNGDFTNSGGTFSHNSGTVTFSASSSQTLSGSTTFNNLKFSSGDVNSLTATISSGTLTVNGTLTINATGITTTINTGVINALGNITLSGGGQASGGSATINIVGTGSQTLTGNGNSTGVSLPKVNINKSSGTLTLSSVIAASNDWTYTAGTLSTTGSTVAFNASATITGSHTLNTVTFYNSMTLGSSTDLTLNGNLNIAGSSALTVNSGTIDVSSGNVTVTNSANGGGGTTLININGAGSQTLTGAGSLSAGALPNININKGSGTLTLAGGTIAAGRGWTYSQGTIATGTTTVSFTSTRFTITGSHSLNNVTFNPTGSATVTIASGTNLTVGGNLTYAGTSAIRVTTGTISVAGDVTVTDTANGGGGDATLVLNGTGTQTINQSGVLQGNSLPNVQINKSSGTAVLTSGKNVWVGGNWTYTAAGGLTATSTTVILTGTSPSISGTDTLNTLTLKPAANSTVTVSNALTLNGDLNYQNQHTITVNSGTINVAGNITLTDTANGGGGTTLLNINGTGTQTITASGVNQGNALPSVTINKSGTLVLASGKNLRVGGNWTYATAGSLTVTSSTVTMVGTSPGISGTHTLNTLTLKPAANSTVTLSNALTLNADLNYQNQNTITVNSGTINVAGNITISDSANGGGGTALITINGTGTQTITASGILQGNSLPSVTINKSGTLVLASGKNVWVGGNWTYTTAGSLTATSSTVTLTGTSPGISGTHTLNTLALKPAANSTVTVSNALTLNSDLNYQNQNTITVNSGTINVAGNITLTDSANGGGGTTLININGTSTQTITAAGVNQGNALPSVTINKTGTLVLASGKNLRVGGNWVYTTAGGLTVTSSTVTMVGTSPSISGTHTLNTLTLKPAANSTVALSNALTLNADLNYQNQNTITVNSGTINVAGNINITDTANGGGGTGLININGTGTQTVTAEGVLQGNALPRVTINKSGTLVLASGKNLRVGNNWTYTTAGALTVTSSTLTLTGTLPTVAGTHTLNTLSFDPTGNSAIVVSNAVTLNGDLNYQGQHTIAVNTGTINVAGNITITDTANGGGGTGLININGTGTQTITAEGVLQGNALPKVTINKSAGTLVLASGKNLRVGGNWTYTTAGGLTVTSSTVTFNGTSPTIAGTHTLNAVSLAPTAASTVTISNALTLSDNLYYNGGSNAMTVNTGTINVSKNISITNTSSSGGGSATIFLTGASAQTVTGTSTGNGYLPNLTVSKGGGDLVIDDTITVAGTLTLNGTSNYLTSSGTHTGYLFAKGNVTLGGSSTANGGGATIELKGSSAQTLSGSAAGKLPNLKINSTGTVTLSGTVQANNNWTYTAGTISPGTSTVVFTGTTYSVTGSHTLANVKFSPASTATATIASGTALTTTATLTFDGTAGLTVNTGTINAGGDITVTNTLTTGGGSALINVNGSGSQTITGTSSSSALPLCNLLINKSAGTLTVTGTSLSAGGSVTCTTGTTVVNSSNTLYLYNSSSINAPAITFNHVSVNSGTRTLGGNLNLAGNLSVPTSTATLDASGGSAAISLQGNWSNSGHFKSGTGYVNFTGTNNQTITQPVSANDSIARLNVNKSGGTLTLSSVVTISDSLKFTSGKLTSDTTNLLVLWRRAKASGMSNTAFVNGPVKKIGNSAFIFPTGKGSDYQPITITAPSVNTDAYVGEYFNSGQAYGPATGDSIAGISTCEYWNLNRTAGTSTVSVTLGWNASSCATDTTINMRVAGWDGSQWNNLGGINPTGNHTTGTITSLPVVPGTLPIGSFVHLVLTKRCNISVTITSSVPSDTICSGNSLTLTANPGGVTFYSINSYTWTNSNNGTTASTQTLSVNATGNYTVTASNSIGCQVHNSVHITVISYPVVTVNSETIFIGSTATLTATGASTYTWTPSTALNATSGATVQASPVVTLVYTVTGTTSGCSASAASTVTVIPDTIPTLAGGSCICVSSFAPQQSKKYLISAWVRERGASPAVTSFTNPVIYIDFASQYSTYMSSAGPFTASGSIIDGWQRIEGTLTIPDTAYYIMVRLQSNSGDVLFDDIRMFPYDASMKSYVYDPVTMRLVAELDERNYATQYEYDEEGKLIRVKKETERGIMTIKEDRNSSVKR